MSFESPRNTNDGQPLEAEITPNRFREILEAMPSMPQRFALAATVISQLAVPHESAQAADIPPGASYEETHAALRAETGAHTESAATCFSTDDGHSFCFVPPQRRSTHSVRTDPVTILQHLEQLAKEKDIDLESIHVVTDLHTHPGGKRACTMEDERQQCGEVQSEPPSQPDTKTLLKSRHVATRIAQHVLSEEGASFAPDMFRAEVVDPFGTWRMEPTVEYAYVDRAKLEGAKSELNDLEKTVHTELLPLLNRAFIELQRMVPSPYEADNISREELTTLIKHVQEASRNLAALYFANDFHSTESARDRLRAWLRDTVAQAELTPSVVNEKYKEYFGDETKAEDPVYWDIRDRALPFLRDVLNTIHPEESEEYARDMLTILRAFTQIFDPTHIYSFVPELSGNTGTKTSPAIERILENPIVRGAGVESALKKLSQKRREVAELESVTDVPSHIHSSLLQKWTERSVLYTDGHEMRTNEQDLYESLVRMYREAGVHVTFTPHDTQP